MKGINETSNAQSWELQVVCKNKKYLTEVVTAILKHNVIDFEVENMEIYSCLDEVDRRYLVTMTSSWFHNLEEVSKSLSKIEDKLENSL